MWTLCAAHSGRGLMRSPHQGIRAFMNEVTLFVQTGKNKHDDACDSLAMLVEFLDTRSRVVTVMKRPF